jgi:hypothetical protein
MDCAGFQTDSQASKSDPLATEYNLANGVVVREHGDNDLAIEEIGHVRCGLESKGRELGHLIRVTDIRNHPIPGSDEVGGHCRTHVTHSDKTNKTLGQRMSI